MLNKIAAVIRWLSVGLTSASVLTGVALAIAYKTWNPIIAWTILAVMIWVVGRIIRYVFTGR